MLEMVDRSDSYRTLVEVVEMLHLNQASAASDLPSEFAAGE